MPTSGVVTSLGAGSAAMVAGPEQRRINVHSRGGGGSSAETTGLQASWMHYSSTHHQWRPRGGPKVAEKELHFSPLPPMGLSQAIPLPHLQVRPQSLQASSMEGLDAKFPRCNSLKFPNSPKSVQSPIAPKLPVAEARISSFCQ